jgi:hypothetical protein
MNDEKGEHVYRYGDASRLTAKKDSRGYMLFTSAAPHVFLSSKTEDKAALEKAQVVKPAIHASWNSTASISRAATILL